MQSKWSAWLHGLLAALISGSSGGIVTAFLAMGLVPDKFNLVNGLVTTVKLAFGSGVVQGLFSAAFYLKQSPLPPDLDSTK